MIHFFRTTQTSETTCNAQAFTPESRTSGKGTVRILACSPNPESKSPDSTSHSKSFWESLTAYMSRTLESWGESLREVEEEPQAYCQSKWEQLSLEKQAKVDFKRFMEGCESNCRFAKALYRAGDRE